MPDSFIPFNVPNLSGMETTYILDAVQRKFIAGNGHYTKEVQKQINHLVESKKVLLTSSCTDALEMSATLAEIQPGDEVIMPSYTFVSTANAFILRGALIRFVDSRKDHPGIDENRIEELINEKTKAIIPVHYAGVACDMDKVNTIAQKHGLLVIEDAAQAIDSYYKGKHLGSLGHLSAFSFHETKNIISGEGGCLAINDEQFLHRAEIIWEKGTNRSAFWRGEVDKYGWVDVGSSFLPSELTAAFLFAQLEKMDEIQTRRKEIWMLYWTGLQCIKDMVQLPFIPDYATNNAHMFYLVTRSLEERTELISYLKEQNINAVFHYLSLHSSPFYAQKHDGRDLSQSDRYTDCLVRLPLHLGLNDNDVMRVVNAIREFYQRL